MNRSSKYNFYLPQNSDPISVSDFNFNFQLIDDNLITVSQSWTSTQKSTARTNIGLGDSATKAVANNLTTTSSGSVLDARQGKALNDKIEKRVLTKTSVTASSSKNIELESGSRYLFIFDNASNSTKAIAIVATNNSGVVSVVKLGEATSLSFNTSTNNVLQITNAATINLDVFYEKLE